MPPGYTIPSATAQGYQFPPLRGSASGWAAQGSRPGQQMQLPPNPFSGGGYSSYGAPAGGFGGFSPMGAYSGQMTPFPSGTSLPGFSGFGSFGGNPFGMSSGGYMPSLGSGSPYSSLGGAAGWSAQMDPVSRFTGSPVPQQGANGMGAGEFAPPLPPGAVYGRAKWSGSDAVDMFVPRGTPVFAPTDGTMGPDGVLRGNNGWTFGFKHGQTTVQGPVRKGQQIGVVNDPMLDMLGNAPWGNMPDKFQHLEMSVSGPGGQVMMGKPGGGGNVNPFNWLQSVGYQGKVIDRTPGPTDVAGGMGYLGGGGGPGAGLGGFGGPGGGIFGGPGGGFGGMPGGMGMGLPGMGPGGPGGFPGLGMGMPGPMGMNPFMMGMPGPMGMPGGMGMNPFMSMFGGRPF